MFVYGKKIQDINKSVVKTLINIFLIVETERLIFLTILKPRVFKDKNFDV